jgi:acyl-CoA hydrolase
MNTVFETNFVVMPQHTNYMAPMIFGGALFSELDLAAASCVTRLLHDSVCDSAVTFKCQDLTFHAAAECGDLVFIRAEIVELRQNAVRVQVDAWRERRAQAGRDKIADCWFVFVTKLDGKFHPHGLVL